MAAEVLQFVCPCCGQHAPIERITEEGPFEFQIFKKTLGGKRRLTEDERKARWGHHPTKGKAPGFLDYSPAPIEKQHRDAIAKRITELLE